MMSNEGREESRIPVLIALRQVRSNPDYADLKPLMRRAVEYIALLEQKMNDSLVLIRLAEQGMQISRNQRSVIDPDTYGPKEGADDE
jgi:hypothetical protein